MIIIRIVELFVSLVSESGDFFWEISAELQDSPTAASRRHPQPLKERQHNARQREKIARNAEPHADDSRAQ